VNADFYRAIAAAARWLRAGRQARALDRHYGRRWWRVPDRGNSRPSDDVAARNMAGWRHQLVVQAKLHGRGRTQWTAPVVGNVWETLRSTAHDHTGLEDDVTKFKYLAALLPTSKTGVPLPKTGLKSSTTCWRSNVFGHLGRSWSTRCCFFHPRSTPYAGAAEFSWCAAFVTLRHSAVAR